MSGIPRLLYQIALLSFGVGAPVLVAYAQDMGWFNTFFFGGGASIGVTGLLDLIVRLLAVLATVVFLWGAFLFIARGDDEKVRSEGRQRMLWGVVGLFLVIGVWGLVNLLISFLGTNTVQQFQATGFTVGT